MSVHISQFYPCSEVSLPCELYYICELGKYLKYRYESCVSIDGVILSARLKDSQFWGYFRMAVDEDWVVDTGLSSSVLAINAQNPIEWDKRTICNNLFTLEEVAFDAEDFKKRNEDNEYNMRTPLLAQISFEKRTDEYWLWSINGEDGKHFLDNNKSLNNTCADQAWLSLVAMVAVTRLKTGSPNLLMLSICGQVVLNVMALSYLLILSEESMCLNGWCHFNLDETISDNTSLQLGYSAWYAKGRDFGMLSRWYSPKEKSAYLKKLDIRAGDLVMLYERDKLQRTNYIKSISGCRLAKITYITDSSVGFEVINTVKPFFHNKESFDDHTMAVKRLYLSNPPYMKLNTAKESKDLTELGVEYMMHGETYFITPLDSSDDFIETRVSDGVRKDTLVLSQNELVYWILKDYKYEFNEERFLARFFPNTEPAYTRYMRGETLETYFYKQDDNS